MSADKKDLIDQATNQWEILPDPRLSRYAGAVIKRFAHVKLIDSLDVNNAKKYLETHYKVHINIGLDLADKPIDKVRNIAHMVLCILCLEQSPIVHLKIIELEDALRDKGRIEREKERIKKEKERAEKLLLSIQEKPSLRKYEFSCNQFFSEEEKKNIQEIIFEQKWSPLQAAIESNALDDVKSLLQAGVDLLEVDMYCQRLRHYDGQEEILILICLLAHRLKNLEIDLCRIDRLLLGCQITICLYANSSNDWQDYCELFEQIEAVLIKVKIPPGKKPNSDISLTSYFSGRYDCDESESYIDGLAENPYGTKMANEFPLFKKMREGYEKSQKNKDGQDSLVQFCFFSKQNSSCLSEESLVIQAVADQSPIERSKVLSHKTN